MSTDAAFIDWEWHVNVFPHRAHDEAVKKLLLLHAEALVLNMRAIPMGYGSPHNDAYAVRSACEKLKAENDALRAQAEAVEKKRGYRSKMHDQITNSVMTTLALETKLLENA